MNSRQSVFDEVERLSNGQLRRLDVGTMVGEFPAPVPWVVEGLAVEGSVTLLTGQPGEGKSLLAGALAVAVAGGEACAGLACRKGRVLIIDAENGEREIHRRVHALGLPASGVEVIEADGWSLARGLDLLDQLLADFKPALLVLDSLRSLWPGGEENDSAAVSLLLDPLRNLVRRHGTATLLPHHSPKVGGAYRGSSAFAASVELGFLLSRVHGDPEPDRRVLSCFKCRPAPEPPRRWLRLTLERGLVLVEEAEPPDEEPRAPARRRDELAPRLLAGLDRAEGAEVALADLCRAVGRGPKDGSVRRLLKDLEAKGEVERGEIGYRRPAGCQRATVPNPYGTWHLAPPPDCAHLDRHGEHHRPHPTTGRPTCHLCHPPAVLLKAS